MLRRRNVPWIQRQSRFIIGVITIIGLILTAYLTITKLAGGEVACTFDPSQPASGCNSVLDSAYAYPFDPQGKTGPPLSLFGAFAYLSMAIFALTPLLVSPEKNKQLRKKLETWSWWLILIGSFAMATFSGYLMYVLAFKIGTVCYYCIGSALFSLSLLVLSIVGNDWEDMGQVFFTGIAIALITFVSSLGIYANADVIADNPTNTEFIPGQQVAIPLAKGEPKPPKGWEVTTISGPAEIALAEHLTKVGAVKYGAYWCPHCYDQKLLFGKKAFDKVNYVECAKDGVNPQTQACVEARVRAFPTWVINGKVYEGTQSLEKLAELTDYQGDTNFRYKAR